MKKLAITGTVGIPARYGGFETLAHNLAEYLQYDFKITVYCSRPVYSKHERRKYLNNIRLRYVPLPANGAISILYDLYTFIHALFTANSILILGISGAMFLPLRYLFKNKPVIVHTDGLEWTREKWGSLAKRILRQLEKSACRHAYRIIADNPVILSSVTEKYRYKTVLIAYGGDHTLSDTATQVPPEFKLPENNYYLCMQRVEPENQPALILETFRHLKHKHLVFIGNWKQTSTGKKLRKQYKGINNIHMIEPVFQQEKLDYIRSGCYVYIHAHACGGTNPSLVEAMYLGLPVICFNNCFNRHTTNNKAIYFKTVSDLKKIIIEDDKKLFYASAEQLQHYALLYYRWEVISDKYRDILV